jgi:hypothetical protein
MNELQPLRLSDHAVFGRQADDGEKLRRAACRLILECRDAPGALRQADHVLPMLEVGARFALVAL